MVRLVSSRHGEDLVWDMTLELDDLRISTEHEDPDSASMLASPLYSKQTAVLCSALQSVLQHRWPDPSMREQLQGLYLSALNNVCEAAYVADWLKPPGDDVQPENKSRHLAGISSTSSVQQHGAATSTTSTEENSSSSSSSSASSLGSNSGSSSSSASSSSATTDEEAEQMPDSSDLYAVLRISNTATPAEVKASFRKLALRYHPDVNTKADAGERFKVMVEAYGERNCMAHVLWS